MANDETEIRLFSSTEKDNTSSIPRTTMFIPYLLFQGKDWLGQWAGFYIPVPM